MARNHNPSHANEHGTRKLSGASSYHSSCPVYVIPTNLLCLQTSTPNISSPEDLNNDPQQQEQQQPVPVEPTEQAEPTEEGAGATEEEAAPVTPQPLTLRTTSFAATPSELFPDPPCDTSGRP